MLPSYTDTAGRPLLCPSLLSCDFARIADEIDRVKAEVDILHCDIMDGHFVPNLTFGPPVVARIRQATDLPLDVHLMVSRPEDWVTPFAEAGADSLVFQIESTVHAHRLATRIKELGCTAGVCLNPATPLNAIEELLPFVDMVLVMTVNPGFGGQAFIAEMIDKVKRLRQISRERNLPLHIQVDGGIDENTAPLMIQAGADMLVAGSAIFDQDDPEAAARKISLAANTAYLETFEVI
jgi:ribulose-phosphate 3-epimerase